MQVKVIVDTSLVNERAASHSSPVKKACKIASMVNALEG